GMRPELIVFEFIHTSFPPLTRLGTKWFCLDLKAGFEAFRTVAVFTGPVLSAVEIAAAAAGVGILDLFQFKVFFPIRTLFLKRSRAIADLYPLDAAVVQLPS